LYYFCFLALEKATGLDKKMEKIPVLSTILVVFIVVIGWVFFRAENIGHAVSYIGAMFNATGVGLADAMSSFYFGEYNLLFVAGIICALPFNQLLKKWSAKRGLEASAAVPVYRWLRLALLMVFLVVATAYLAKGSYNPFIYFNF